MAEQPTRRGKRRWLVRASAGALLCLAAAGTGVWIERKSIATHYVDRLFAEAGVQGRYTIQQLGPFRQRISGVSIGDPADPDLIADWIELDTGFGWSGPSLRQVRAGQLTLSARVADGKLSVGSLDRLMPRTSGSGTAKLPDLIASVEWLRATVATPAGTLAIAGQGAGNLADGFSGRFRVSAPSLGVGTCHAAAFDGMLALGTRSGHAAITGPVASGAGRCRGAAMASAHGMVDATFSRGFDAVSGRLQLALDAVRHLRASAETLRVSADFAGPLSSPRGTLRARAAKVAAAGLAARGAGADGNFAVTDGVPTFRGKIAVDAARLPADLQHRLASYADAAAGTPIAGVVRAWSGAAAAIGRQFDMTADLRAAPTGATLLGAVLTAPSGARMVLGNGGIALEAKSARVDVTLSAGGGGLPNVRARLAGDPRRGFAGEAMIAPYAAGGSTVGPTRVRFSPGPWGLDFATELTLSGPLGAGRIEGLRVPVSGTVQPDGGIIVGRDCADARFASAAIQSLRVGATRLRLCPVDGAWFRQSGGRTSGGVAIAQPRIGGELGGSPLSLAAARAQLSLGTRGFDLAGLAVQLGAPGRPTRLDVARLEGSFQGALDGSFADAAGQIGAVPLLLSGAKGKWRLDGGRLELDGTLSVADAAADPRYKPMAGEDVRLTLADGRIVATGRLVEPVRRVAVADVTITHDLSSGSGRARLAVPGIDFGKGFQPEDLTRLTFGVIADVKGRLSGEGEIDWSNQGVTSTGVFRTDGIDLAAALGPVQGISGEIRFTDLLNLESAPGQRIRVLTINPGVPVSDGMVYLQTLSGARVKIEDATWDFAGGKLRLRPTLLDFSQPAERFLTFDVTGVDAGQFLQQFDFKNLNATGMFDGTLPMIFDAKGGRIEGGHLSVRAAGGGTIAYVGEVTQKDVGFWGNFAFQALKSLRYRNLEITMNGPLDGEMITQVNFAGLAQGVGAKRNFLFDRLQKLPLVFNVEIRAPFRQLVDSAQSFYDPRRLVERNLPALLREQNNAAPAAAPASPAPPVQPR